MSGAEFLGSKEFRPEFESVYVDVWPDQLATLDVFAMCEISVVAGQSKLYWIGLPASEIESSMNLLGIQASDRLEMSKDLKYMAAVVCSQANQSR